MKQAAHIAAALLASTLGLSIGAFAPSRLASAQNATSEQGASASGSSALERSVPDEIRSQIAASIPAEYGLGTIEVPKSLDIGRGATVTLGWRGAPRSGKNAIFVEVTRGEKVRRGFVSAEIRILETVIVAQRNLRVGDTIGLGDLQSERRPVAPGEGIRSDPAAFVGSPVLREIRAGAMIESSTIGQPVPLRQGSPLRVIVQRGAIKVSGQGTLERTARPGETAWVRMSSGGRTLSGRLIDRNTIFVDGGSP